MRNIGIDAVSFYVPELYLDLQDLAQERNIEYAKLNKGLGLSHMAVADKHEDAASFAANALLYLIKDNKIDPREIGRIYMGTESALDAAKPTATYAMEVVESVLEDAYGPRSFKHCDILDMTFACVGAVDALHNSMDWVKAGTGRKAIVIASDIAKYDLESTGEYTQGAGAVAMLVTEDPELLAINDVWGVATRSVGDFFKPRRRFSKLEVFKKTAHLLGVDVSDEEIEALFDNANCEFWSTANAELELFREEPVFDGPYSNACYQERITEALDHFTSQSGREILAEWDHLVFHLPYAFQARRMFADNWYQEMERTGQLSKLIDEIGERGDLSEKDWKRKISKSSLYQNYVKDKISQGEAASSLIGNMYTASIFMSLLSMLSLNADAGHELAGQRVGFISYGSGSKSKVFEATIQEGWKSRLKHLKLFETLKSRKRIDVETYENLHKNKLELKLTDKKIVQLSGLGTSPENLGLREYSLR